MTKEQTNILIKEIEKFMIKNKQKFFNYAWREKIGEILLTENKYNKLIDWINIKLESYETTLNVLNPIDDFVNERFTNKENDELFIQYKQACSDIAMLINYKWIILDDKCSIKMRENIEKIICKLYKIHYNENLKIYIEE